jgi:hypothetical protein
LKSLLIVRDGIGEKAIALFALFKYFIPVSFDSFEAFDLGGR